MSTKNAENSGCLVLVRHGQSEWNEQNLFTGWCDPDLTALGKEEARQAGYALKELGFVFDWVFTSALRRAQHTNRIILEVLGQTDKSVVVDASLNERDYGELSGLNKDAARKRWGKEQIHIWRRSYDIPPPGGESLKDTAARVLPYYKEAIAPRIEAGETVLVTAHGNSLRALSMSLEGMTSDQVLSLNIGTGEPYIYRVGATGVVTSKEVLKI
ncbi:MAG: 2,3-bisphosphoglycerate-dependent phosphoglycerate mutase [Parvularculales bacterium]